MRYFSPYILIALVLSTASATAQAPDSVAFQGFLTDTLGNQIDSTGVVMTFRLYKDGAPVWTETQSVEISNGVFSVLLGKVTDLSTLAFNGPMDLGVELDGIASEMSPRTPLAAAAYAKALPGLYTFYRGDGSNAGYNVVGGAYDNSVGNLVVGATISGGGGLVLGTRLTNNAQANFATVGGGAGNTASGTAAVVPGGYENNARGHSSFAAGFKARANHDGTFVWSDRTNISGNDSLVSTDTDQFIIGASNGVGINRAPANYGLHIKQRADSSAAGIRTEFSDDTDYWDTWIDFYNDYNFGYNDSLRSWIDFIDGTFWKISDARLKEDFQPFRDVLPSISQLHPSTYRFKHVAPDGARSLGLTAQEVESLFPELVSEKTGMKGVNYGGLSVVAIKAIQELHNIVTQQQVEIDRLREIVEAAH